MVSKHKLQTDARHLRHKGLSLNEISSHLGISKSSASTWVRDVKLTKKQQAFLGHKAHFREIIQKRVATRMKNEDAKRRDTMNGHKNIFPLKKLSPEHLLIIGTILYWAEGGKSHKNRSFNFTNSDPRMIQVMMSFLKTVCHVPEKKFHAHIHLHSHLDVNSAEKYWSSISNISRSQFYKTTQVINKASKDTRDTLPYGTFSIQIGSTDLFLKMLAWIEVITEKATGRHY